MLLLFLRVLRSMGVTLRIRAARRTRMSMRGVRRLRSAAAFALMTTTSSPIGAVGCRFRALGYFGTARALQLNAEAGAYAGLALGLQALLGSLLIPLIHTLFR